MRYKAVISYDGTLFHGFQKQKNHRSVQEELENAIYKAFDQKKKSMLLVGPIKEFML